MMSHSFSWLLGVLGELLLMYSEISFVDTEIELVFWTWWRQLAIWTDDGSQNMSRGSQNTLKGPLIPQRLYDNSILPTYTSRKFSYLVPNRYHIHG
jgi:hypothetical protein